MLRKYVVSLYVLVLPTYNANVTVSVRPYTRAGCADGGDRGVLDGWGVGGELQQFGGDFVGKCGKSLVEVCGNGRRTGGKRRERCSEDGGVRPGQK